ncbi:MAG: DUF362 domain-containing protein [Rhodothermales bacterium]|nr:DUF362 domain-containing protein [Rhodothermales bacterium]
MFDTSTLKIAGGLAIPMPAMARVRQTFDVHRLPDLPGAVREQVLLPDIRRRIIPGASIAVGVGSRGVANLEELVRALVGALKEAGARPFVFPAMGSHGGATAEGQTRVLADYGVTEARVGAPVRATMDTVEITRMPDGTVLHMDRLAHEADGIVLINRIKPHTTVRGPIQSGVIKMMVIGMGKIAGASIMHTDHGMDRFAEVLPQAAACLMERIPFLFGIGVVEDAYDHTAHIEALPPETLLTREAALLTLATAYMPRICFDDIDVLVIDRIGKEISGSGFDPNIAGRNSRGVTGFDRPRVQKVVVLDLTDQTHGNATGVGMADVITRRLLNRVDFNSTYANVITSAYLDGAAIPLVMDTAEDAVRLAVKTLLRVKPEHARIVRIADTLSLAEIHASEPLLAEARRHPNLTVVSDPAPMRWG